MELCLYLCQTNIFEVCESCSIPLPAMAAILHFAKSVKCFHIKIHISYPLIFCILVMFMMYIKSWMSNSEWSRDLTAIFDFLSITCKPVSNNLFYRGNGIISHIIMCITNSRPPCKWYRNGYCWVWVVIRSNFFGEFWMTFDLLLPISCCIASTKLIFWNMTCNMELFHLQYEDLINYAHT